MHNQIYMGALPIYYVRR